MSNKLYSKANPRFSWDDVKTWEDLHSQGMQYTEIAREVGVSDGYVRGKCSMYRRKIKPLLKNDTVDTPESPTSIVSIPTVQEVKSEKNISADEDYLLIKEFWESLPQEFDTQKAVSLGTQLGISRPTIERYLNRWQGTKLDRLFRGNYKKKEEAPKPVKKPSLSDFTPREIIQYMYGLGYRIDKDGLYQIEIKKNRVKLSDII